MVVVAKSMNLIRSHRDETRRAVAHRRRSVVQVNHLDDRAANSNKSRSVGIARCFALRQEFAGLDRDSVFVVVTHHFGIHVETSQTRRPFR